MAAPSAVEKTWPQKNEMQLISHNLETRMGFYARIFRGGKAQLLYCAGIVKPGNLQFQVEIDGLKVVSHLKL